MTDEVKVEQIDAIKQAEEWLRAIHDWLLTFDYDMDLPSGILDVDPLDIADRLAARPAPAEDAVERVEMAKRLFWTDTAQRGCRPHSGPLARQVVAGLGRHAAVRSRLRPQVVGPR